MTSSFFDQLADAILDGKPATEDDALAVLRAHDDELLDVVAAAGRLRREHFGNTVKVNYLVNLKSGLWYLEAKEFARANEANEVSTLRESRCARCSSPSDA